MKSSKGFIITVLVFFAFASLLALSSDFSEYQYARASVFSDAFQASKVLYAWEDIKEDVTRITQLNITIEGKNATFDDVLPATIDILALLNNYSAFVNQYYVGGDLNVKYLDPIGVEIGLDNLPSQITIFPWGITYGYPDQAKRELNIKSPVANVTAFVNITLIINLTSASINQSDGFDWNPYQKCRPNKACLTFNVTIYDATSSLTSPEFEFDLTRQSQAKVACVQPDGSGDCFIRFTVGEAGNSDPQNVVRVELQKANVTISSRILFNNTGFYTNYLSKLRVNDVNFNTSRTDWLG